MTEKTKHLGRESGKSSDKVFGPGVGHPKGHGASAGDGQTTDKTVAGKIKVETRDASGKLI
jgi:hypothetical protein